MNKKCIDKGCVDCLYMILFVCAIIIIIEQTLQEFDFFELIGVCFKYILIFLVGIC